MKNGGDTINAYTYALVITVGESAILFDIRIRDSNNNNF